MEPPSDTDFTKPLKQALMKSIMHAHTYMDALASPESKPNWNRSIPVAIISARIDRLMKLRERTKISKK
ncbi:MAG: hypothetical protein ABR962_00835 [Candidatus Bathyarchaeia archaeon]|jgi:hypothetical protein